METVGKGGSRSEWVTAPSVGCSEWSFNFGGGEMLPLGSSLPSPLPLPCQTSSEANQRQLLDFSLYCKYPNHSHISSNKSLPLYSVCLVSTQSFKTPTQMSKSWGLETCILHARRGNRMTFKVQLHLGKEKEGPRNHFLALLANIDNEESYLFWYLWNRCLLHCWAFGRIVFQHLTEP